MVQLILCHSVFARDHLVFDGDHKDNGADGLVVKESDRYIQLLDFREYGVVNHTSVDNFLTPNPLIKNLAEYSFIRPVCSNLKMNERECNALINKFFDIRRYSYDYYQILKSEMKSLKWKLVNKIREIDDEGSIVSGTMNNVIFKMQIAKRTGRNVSIRKKGWLKNYKLFTKPMNALNKIGIIFHELILSITKSQGDETSERARRINAMLFKGRGCQRITTSFFELTGIESISCRDVLSRKEIRWIAKSSHENVDYRIYYGSIIDKCNYSCDYTYYLGNCRPCVQNARKKLFIKIHNSLLSRGYAAERFNLLSLNDYYLDVATSIDYKKFGTINITDYTDQLGKLNYFEKDEFADFFVKEKLIYELNRKAPEYYLNEDHGLFLEKNISLCNLNGKRFRLPKEFRNKTFFSLGLAAPKIQFNESGIEFVSYRVLVRDKYLENKNTCLKYNIIENKNKITFVASILQTVFEDNGKKKKRRKLKIVDTIKILFDKEIKNKGKCPYLITNEYKVMMENVPQISPFSIIIPFYTRQNFNFIYKKDSLLIEEREFMEKNGYVYFFSDL